MDDSLTTLERVQAIKNILVARATNGTANVGGFTQLRIQLLRDPAVKGLLPSFLRTCTTLDEFWGFIKPKFSSYSERRDFIRAEFESAVQRLEGFDSTPFAEGLEEVLKIASSADVNLNWQKSLDRSRVDPAGAITSARSLVE
jgi:hypothetical protein